MRLISTVRLANLHYTPGPSNLYPQRFFSQTHTILSGHNKWSKIKQKKGVNDMQKAVVFARAARDIQLAVRHGGSTDPEINAMLASALKKAKSSGVPKDNIEKALSQASGAGAKEGTRTIYEVMFSKDIGVLIECQSDNPARTFKRLRETLSSHGARLAPVNFLFERIGCVRVALENDNNYEKCFESLWDAATEAGAEDFDEYNTDSVKKEIEIICPPEALANLTNTIYKAIPSDGLLSSELRYRSKRDNIATDDNRDVLSDSELATAENLKEFVEELKENEECVEVWTTWDDKLEHTVE